jgi:hypothetical protein
MGVSTLLNEMIVDYGCDKGGSIYWRKQGRMKVEGKIGSKVPRETFVRIALAFNAVATGYSLT